MNNSIASLLSSLQLSPHSAAAYGAAPYARPGSTLTKVSPIDGATVGTFEEASNVEYTRVIEDATAAFQRWRSHPAPKRGELVRDISNAIRAQKALLGELVSRETGKIRAEGEGEDAVPRAPLARRRQHHAEHQAGRQRHRTPADIGDALGQRRMHRPQPDRRERDERRLRKLAV